MHTARPEQGIAIKPNCKTAAKPVLARVCAAFSMPSCKLLPAHLPSLASAPPRLCSSFLPVLPPSSMAKSFLPLAKSIEKRCAQKIDPSKSSKKVAKNSGGKNFGKKSHIDFALQTRHIDTAGKRTTIALEKAFWRQADSQAEKVGQPWQQWAACMLEDRPGNIGKARWLRVRLLMEGD